jgi:DNA (cytosine-5)-methyltransferase 1|nr:MAG TPA: Cytosine specific methyltransferase [Bacteriophage sp.]
MNQINIFDIMRQPVQITKPIRLIELFAGYGSQAMALKRIGAKFEHYRVVEFDKYAIASYNAVHGTDFPTMDITKVHADDLNICDTESFTYLLTYSFPCTDLSVAGKQMGMSKGSGTRSGLLWEVERILKEIRDGGGELPQILFMENVPQVHADANRVDFQNWIDFLTSLGYVSYWQDLNAKNYGVAQNRERCFMFSFLGEYNYHFPQQIPLKKKLKDYLEYDVDEKYYINNEKSEKLIKQLIENGTLPKNNHESRLALTEQSAIHIRETLQTASLQDMTQESATYGQKETVLLKAVDLSINNPKEKIIANCILSHVSKDGNTIGKYASLNTGVIECKKLKL